MIQYFFILGKNPTLSISEIISVLKSIQIAFIIKVISPEVLIIETESEIVIERLIKTLGGTIKIGQIIQQVSFDEDEAKFQQIFDAENIIHNYLAQKNGKVHFGISIYDGGTDQIYLKKINAQLKDLNLTIKENFKNEGVKAGFVKIKDRFLSSVSVSKNQLLSKGVEIVLILTKDKIFAGKTLVVQEFESFSFRDYSRPARDTKSGIIPPKLARIMINLAVVDEKSVILDPFCGSGTILQEAILLGYRKIIGADISKKAFTDSMVNIDWLFNHYNNLNSSEFNIDVYQCDVQLIGKKFAPNSIDAIVTEPYLGPPFFKKPNYGSIMNTLSEVEKLYLSAFSEFKKILRKNGKIVIVFPAFEDWGKMHFVNILDKIKEMGFSKEELIPKEMINYSFIQLTNRNTILYGGNEQFVKREIISWKKL